MDKRNYYKKTKIKEKVVMEKKNLKNARILEKQKSLRWQYRKSKSMLYKNKKSFKNMNEISIKTFQKKQKKQKKYEQHKYLDKSIFRTNISIQLVKKCFK